MKINKSKVLEKILLKMYDDEFNEHQENQEQLSFDKYKPFLDYNDWLIKNEYVKPTYILINRLNEDVMYDLSKLSRKKINKICDKFGVCRGIDIFEEDDKIENYNILLFSPIIKYWCLAKTEDITNIVSMQLVDGFEVLFNKTYKL